MKQHTHRKAWLPILSAVVQFLFGPTLMLYLLDIRITYYSNEPVTPLRVFSASLDYLKGGYGYMQVVILIVGAILVSVFGFQYLFSKRMTDLYQSTAITRKKQFAAGYLCGFLYWLIPSLVSALLTALVIFVRIGDSSYFGRILTTMATLQLLNILLFLAVYHLCLVAVTISGNIFNTLVNIGILGLSAIGVYAMLYAYESEYFKTFSELTFSVWDIGWLSPLVTPIISYIAINDGPASSVSADATIVHLLIGCAILMLIQGYIAYRLYLKRPSEHAERGTREGIYTLASKFILSVLAGLFGAWFIGNVIDGRSIGLVWGIFICIVLSLISHGLLDMAFQVSFKAFWGHKIMLIVTPICACILFGTFESNIWKYDEYLPKAANIKSATVTCYHFTDDSFPYLAEDGTIRKYNYDMEMPTITLTDAELIHSLLEDGIAFTKVREFSDDIYITVEKKFGGTYKRSYSLTEEGYKLLAAYLESDESLHASYPASCGDFPVPDQIYVDSNRFQESQVENYIYSPDKINQFMAAYSADFMEHHTVEDLSNFDNVGYIEFIYNTQDRWGPYISLDIPSNYQRTIALLEEISPLILEFTPDLRKNLQFANDLDEETSEYLSSLTDEEMSEIVKMQSYHKWSINYTDLIYIGETGKSSTDRSISCYVSAKDLP